MGIAFSLLARRVVSARNGAERGARYLREVLEISARTPFGRQGGMTPGVRDLPMVSRKVVAALAAPVLSLALAAGCSSAPTSDGTSASASEAVSAPCSVPLQGLACSTSESGSGSSSGGTHHVNPDAIKPELTTCLCVNTAEGTAAGPASACGTPQAWPLPGTFNCTIGVGVSTTLPYGNSVFTTIWACDSVGVNAALNGGNFPSSIDGLPPCSPTLTTECSVLAVGAQVDESCVGAPASSDWTYISSSDFFSEKTPHGCTGGCPGE